MLALWFERGGEKEDGRKRTKRGQAESERLIRIVSAESEHDVPIWMHHDGVATHWGRWEGLVVHEGTGFLFRAHNGLEGVAVQMEGMFARI